MKTRDWTLNGSTLITTDAKNRLLHDGLKYPVFTSTGEILAPDSSNSPQQDRILRFSAVDGKCIGEYPIPRSIPYAAAQLNDLVAVVSQTGTIVISAEDGHIMSDQFQLFDTRIGAFGDVCTFQNAILVTHGFDYHGIKSGVYDLVTGSLIIDWNEFRKSLQGEHSGRAPLRESLSKITADDNAVYVMANDHGKQEADSDRMYETRFYKFEFPKGLGEPIGEEIAYHEGNGTDIAIGDMAVLGRKLLVKGRSLDWIDLDTGRWTHSQEPSDFPTQGHLEVIKGLATLVNDGCATLALTTNHGLRIYDVSHLLD